MPITNLKDIATRIAQGKMSISLAASVAATAATAAAANSGLMSMTLVGNAIGSTYPGTLVGFQEAPALVGDYLNLMSFIGNTASARGGALVRVYLAGTLNLTATGNQFTHNAAVFPLLRKKYGAANQPASFIPIIQLTAATSVTAPAFTLATNAGGAGYKNQDGVDVVGTKVFTLPAAASAIGSCYFLRLNDGDWAAEDIIQINVTTASTTGTANIWLMEEIAPSQALVAGASQYDNFLDAGLDCASLTPAVATSGSAVSRLLFATYGSATSTAGLLNIAVLS